ncbi:MAG: hypothetical protein QME94_18810, partial [Anaerolineae bacterium]|nr:hypothetical protein [Anaerolineae bacterium]
MRFADGRTCHRAAGAGAATLFAALLAAPAAADWPENAWLVWSSNREDGRHEVYLQGLGRSNITRLTTSGGILPSWSPDGRWISYKQGDADTGTSIRLVRWDGTEDHEICAGAPARGDPVAFWMHDNAGLVCMQEVPRDAGTEVQYNLVNPESGKHKLLFSHDSFTHLRGQSFAPGGISRDQRWLVGWAYGLYSDGYTGTNGTFKAGHSTVALDIENKTDIYFIGPGCLAAVPPAGPWLYHVSREGSTMPDIFRIRADDLATRGSYVMELGNADADWGHEYMPSISNDNRWLVYAASVGCHNWYTCDYEIFVHRLGAPASERTRVTENPANDNFPSLHIGPLWRPGLDFRVALEDVVPARTDRRGEAPGLDRSGSHSQGCGCQTAGVP